MDEMTEKHTKIHVPPKGTRGDRIGGGLMMRLARPIMRRHVSRYSQVTTPEPGKFRGFPVLVLTTIGSRSGKERTHVLGGFPDGDDAWLIVASKAGAVTHPAWFHNLARNPELVWAQVGNRKFKANVESLVGTEREQAYARVCEVAPIYAGYLKKTDREIPVLRLTPAS
jgi:deazaflavin-dependent oxidoreductase (nitroreductase family)